MANFVHLHVHSEYSLLDGASRIAELARKAAESGMKALALTDHGVMYGAVPFYKACMEAGIKPIIGCEVYITAQMAEKASRKEQPIYHLILLARNEEGYRNLMRLTSEAHLRGYHYKPRIDLELLSKHAEGLVCLSSCMGGEIARHILADRLDEAVASAERHRAVFGKHYYLELQDHGLYDQKKVIQGVLEVHKRTGIPLVATNDVHYVNYGEHQMQDVLVCIGTGKTVEDEERLKFHTDQMYLKNGAEMSSLFAYAPEAIANTERIAELCDLKLELGKPVLPKFEPLPEGTASGAYLASLCREALEPRYGGLPGWLGTEAGTPGPLRREAEERLAYELSIIDRMGYNDYFLIVWDFIRYAHEKGIAVGPGRGSSAGSLVAYVLRITDVDPLKYRLLFERFLNPERVSMPDIDIDFSDERRDEVIAYVSGKYGADRVAQIITFGTMAAKAAVRDVGRALNVPFGDVDRAAKLIPHQLGVTIESALEQSSELRELCVKQPKVGELIEMARKVEGLPRHASTHAAGVVIAPGPLTDLVPLQEGTAGAALTQYSMENIEAVGLLKMDFLGLRTLSIIERTLAWIEELYGVKLDLRDIPDDDAATYDMLGRGEAIGVFQLESPGMRRVIRDLKPSSFEDIISVLALYRPGPMEFIPKFIRAKHGQEQVEYPHPSLAPILADTYGIIVYQEQIMQIASRMAGFRLGEADLLRRAVSKKKRDVLDEQRAKFVAGSVEQGYTQTDANAVYDMIVRFADYGFPRAHATAYGVLAYRTAYLKAHYPVPFLASMLASVIGNHRSTAVYVDECRRLGIGVLPPDVNESGVSFTPIGQTGIPGGPESPPETPGSIRFGLAAIKNVGTQAIESILQERKKGPYTSLIDLCRRIDLRVCNKRVIESLVMSGALSSLPGHRAQQLAALDETVDAAAKWKKDRDDLQIEFFELPETINWTVELPEVRSYSAMEELELERDYIGMYISGHPLDSYGETLAQEGFEPLYLLPEQADGSEALVAGMVVSSRSIVTKKGQPMAFVEIEDRADRVEVVLFPDLWKQAAPIVQRGKLVALRAKVQLQDEGGVKLLAEAAAALEDPELQAKLRAPAARDYAGSPRGGGRPPKERGAAGRGTIQAAAGGGTPSSGGKAEAADPVPQAGQHQRAGTPARSRSGEGQRVYIKIAPDREAEDTLKRLRSLLLQHSGALPVVLFYEREHRIVELPEKYKVKPSPQLIKAVEELLGAGTARVK